MIVKKFTSNPKTIKAMKFIGKNYENTDWLKIKNTNLPEDQRIGIFYNLLHDKDMEVSYGDWIVFTNHNDIYPIKEDVLFRDYTPVGLFEDFQEAVQLLRGAKRRFSPDTTNSVADMFISETEWCPGRML